MGKLRQHSNAFDFVRLIAAGLVLWSHQHALMGLPQPSIQALQASFGGLGLFIFFAVSGYLNTRSLAQHRSVRVFLLNRVLRIYPALVACVLFTVILGLFVATDLHAYLGPKLLSYVAKNSTLFFGVKTGVPGVFEGNVYPHELNGSLWSLPYEVKMYVVLALCLAGARYNLAVPIIAFLGAGVITFLAAVGILPATPEGSNWLVFSTFFLAGSFIAATQAFANLPFAVGALSVVSIVFAVVGQHLLAWELALTAIVIMVGCLKLPMRLRLPIDISYGVYLYAFPVQQLSAMLFTEFWLALTFSALLTFALALMSALFIESYALSFKNKLQRSLWPKELLMKYVTQVRDLTTEAKSDKSI
jgi:peptidoglycan/LPS O-acetylase OafA/YrhL